MPYVALIVAFYAFLFLWPARLSAQVSVEGSNLKLVAGVRTLFTSSRLLALRQGSREETSVEFQLLWGLLVFRQEVPRLQLRRRGMRPRLDREREVELGMLDDSAEEAEGPAHRLIKAGFRLLRRLRSYKAAGRFFRQRLRVTRAELRGILGTGDAASTAVLYGAAWGLLGTATALLYQFLDVRSAVELSLEPRYQERRLHVEGHARAWLHQGELFIAFLIGLYLFVRDRLWAGRRALFETGVDQAG